ncbi:MAG TPA: terminase family protein, partial [bacterium]|nr:terminase family protein [bacterium]
GGRGSGKTFGGALRTARYHATWRGARQIVTTPTYSMMHSSTLPALFDVFALHGWVRGSDWDYNRTDERIDFVHGGQIFLLSTEHPERIRGQDVACVWMDEPRDSPHEAFLNAQATMRQQGFPHQMALTTTPIGRGHWSTRTFCPGKAFFAEGEEPPDTSQGIYLVYFARTRDNPHGGAELHDHLIRTFGDGSNYARQELEGALVLTEGLVYDTWDPEKHVVPMEQWPVRSGWWHVISGVDFGHRSPSCILVEAIDKAGRRYIVDELYQARLSEHELCVEAIRLRKKWGIEYFNCDTEDPRWIATMKSPKYRLPALNAKKRIGTVRNPSSGIGLCRWELTEPLPDGSQRFYVAPHCKHFIEEIEGYVYEDPKLNRDPDEMPRRQRNHAMDSWRYAATLI